MSTPLDDRKLANILISKVNELERLIKGMRVKQTNLLSLKRQSAEPANPSSNNAVIWMSDGTGAGDAGDIMIKINNGGTTKTATLVDYSTLP